MIIKWNDGTQGGTIKQSDRSIRKSAYSTV